MYKPKPSFMRHLVLRCNVIVAIMMTELRLQRRSLALWLFLVIACAFSTVLTIAFNSGELKSSLTSARLSVDLMLDTALYSSLVGFVGLPFLFMGTFGRDQRYKVKTLLWSRPLLAIEYTAGKALAVIVISMLFSTLPLTLGWIVGSIRYATFLPVMPWLQFMLALWPGYILTGLFALFCLVLAPIPLIGTIIAVGMALFFLLGISQNMYKPTNIALLSIYYSPEMQFGPDTFLVYAQSLVFLALALVCIGLVLCLLQCRERLISRSRLQWLGSSLLVLLALLLSFSSLSNFQSLAATYDDPASYPANPMRAQISQYHLSVEANTSTGRLKGRASFLITPQEKGIKSAYVMLARSLELTSAKVKEANAIGEQAVVTQTNAGWTKFDLAATLFAQGQPIYMSMEYEGLLNMNRFNYAKPVASFAPPESHSAINYDRVSYIGQDMAFLHGLAGSWYPLPWTEQVFSIQSARPVIDDLTLRLPAQLTVFSSLGATWKKPDGQWQELHVQLAKSLPIAVLGAFTHAQQSTIAGSTVFQQGEPPTKAYTKKITQYINVLQAIDKEFGLNKDKPTHWRVVLLPSSLFTTVYLNQDTLFLPYPDKYLYAWMDNNGAATSIATAWWENALTFPQTYRKYTVPDSTRSYTLVRVDGALFSILTKYTTKMLVEQLGAGDEFEREGSVLNKLAERDGKARINLMLREFKAAHTSAQSPISLRAFVSYANSTLGRDISREIAVAACPERPIKTEADITSCLSSDGKGS